MENASLLLRAASVLLDITWKSLLVFAAAGLVFPLLRRRSAAVRHTLWLSVFVSLLCLPALCLWLPRRTLLLLPAAVRRPPLPVLASQAQATAEFPVPRSLPTESLAAPPSLPPLAGSGEDPAPASLTAPIASRPAPAPWPPMAWLALLWLGGFAAALARTGLGLASARRQVLGCAPILHGPLVEAAESARQALCPARRVTVRQGTSEQAVAVPMTFGAFRPVIVLPQEAAAWPVDRLRVVLLHELAHVGRGDWLTLMLAQIVCALYWFHPLVWLAARRLRSESEEACDDRVLTCGIPAPDYAAHLLEIVRALPQRGGALPVSVTMVQNREIAGRLKTILMPAKDRHGMTRRGLGLALLAGFVLALPLAAMHPARRPAPATIKAVAVLTDVPWTARLSDGTLIQLVSVVKANWKGREVGKAWKPDGSPLGDSGAALGKGGLTTSVDAFLDQREVVALHMTATPPKPYTVFAVSTSDNRRGHLNIGLRFSAGPYTTLVSAPLGQSASRRLPSGEVVTLSRGVTGRQNSPLVGGKPRYLTSLTLSIPMRFLTPDYESQIEATDADGRAVVLTNYFGGSPDGSGATRRIVYHYRPSDLKSRHVTGFRFIARPADHFTFYDVALQPNPTTGAAKPAGPVPISQVFDPLDKDPAVRERARRQRIATALRLRGSLQGWAERNADLLRQMRQARPDDLPALLRVYARVPPLEAYLNRGETQSASEFGALGAPPTLSHLRNSQEPLNVHLREDFAKYRDFRLSRSVNTGRTSITLWASGRITETTWTDRVVGHTRLFAVDLKDTADIAPAYPFLK